MLVLSILLLLVGFVHITCHTLGYFDGRGGKVCSYSRFVNSFKAARIDSVDSGVKAIATI